MKPNFMRKKKKAAAAAGAAEALKKLPTAALVGTINQMIGIINSRGVEIRDWDDRDKVVHGMRCYGNNKVFILAPRKTPVQEVRKDVSDE